MDITFHQHHLSKQRGMGATVILFTIALIVLVGAALAYSSRGSSKSLSVESAKVYSAIILKQSGEYREAYNRFIFDGNSASTMTFDTTSGTGLFDPNKQYGINQSAPAQAITTGATDAAWQYNKSIFVSGIGIDTTGGADSIVYLNKLSLAACQQINLQMYGDPIGTTIPSATIALADFAINNGTKTITAGGRATGCVATSDPFYIFYSTLAEN
ncbi:hypothetical protein [Actimicrobium sp. CCI2.3]|uniref:hypothetical protein n=1 Tax=Actimicrobium sp. CCI2.3 TaxID=3048616 RepID=UPI002AB38216|nr:hypothetical protein [Actimicrobium sp. CCI2.3]MDY7572985.1 hypothetical protein [Actimicrobium sp. CCI2.3]MEB0023637.1 hypothetical protein [Actimicrobium sp. CCI2.3]